MLKARESPEGRERRAHRDWSGAGNGRVRDASGVNSDGNGEHVTRHRGKGGPRHKVAKNLGKFGSNVLWRTELVNTELGYLAKDISKHSV